MGADAENKKGMGKKKGKEKGTEKDGGILFDQFRKSGG